VIRIGIDVGGTNTDAVVMDGGDVLAGVKAPTTKDVMSGVVAALEKALEASKLEASAIDVVMIGTTHFTNAVLEVINRGKGGNLRPLDMGNAITAELSEIFAPVNTSPPVISGTATVGSTLTSTVGNWTYVPTSYAYQWLRGGTTMIPGATAATYVLQAADSGQSISMRLTATNAAGSTPIVSNAIAVA